MDELSKNKTVKYWLDSAEYDLKVTADLFDKKKYHYSLFFGHLAIEKLLKAIYVQKHTTHAPYSHSLPYLAEKADLNLDNSTVEKLAEFMEFYLEGRYPKDLKSILKKCDKVYSSKKIKEMKEIFKCLKKRLKE